MNARALIFAILQIKKSFLTLSILSLDLFSYLRNSFVLLSFLPRQLICQSLSQHVTIIFE